MWPDDLGLNVSRESLEKLNIYHALLLKWQKAINLVSPKTVEDAWVRHFADSAQLLNFISDDVKVVMDWGSGAGFPAMVLAILRSSIEFHVVESDERKCQFIRTVSRETSVPIRIHTQRIEDLELDSVNPHLITARALASARNLLGYAVPWVERSPELKMLLLKGEGAQAELDEAAQGYKFDVELSPSVTEPSASIAMLSSIRVL